MPLEGICRGWKDVFKGWKRGEGMFESSFVPGQGDQGSLSRGAFLSLLEESSTQSSVSVGLKCICKYVNASGYLLVRNNGSEDFVISSNWPYDFARDTGKFVLQHCACPSSFSEEYPAFEPKFLDISAIMEPPKDTSSRICIMPFSCGDSCFMLLLMFEQDASCSYDRLKDAAMACSYHVAEFNLNTALSSFYNDLTEREMECLSWISLGKTSDEIALIIGISRNTVNNYITSIMNKTATKSRAEAVAEAVRSELI